MFSYSYFETFALFLGALTVGFCIYEEVIKRLANEPEKPAAKPSVKHQYKPPGTIAQQVVKKPLYQRFEVEIKDSNVVHELTIENFQELLSQYFIAVNYLQELWIQHPFKLILTDDLKTHYGKNKALNGFIRIKQIPEIYIKASTSSKHRTAVLIHEIAHLKAEQEGTLKNVRIASHGPLFKKHMRLLFKPLLVDKTYYRKHYELSHHLKNEATKFSPTKNLCI